MSCIFSLIKGEICDKICICEGHIESLWIELFPKTKQSMLFCCVYRPPSQHTFLIIFLHETAHLQCPRIAVLGDMNADLLKPSCSQTKLLSVMKHLHLVDLVCVPTRVTLPTALLRLMCC